MKILNAKDRKYAQEDREMVKIIAVFEGLMKEAFEHYVGEISEEDFKEFEKNLSNWSMAAFSKTETDLEPKIDFELDLKDLF